MVGGVGKVPFQGLPIHPGMGSNLSCKQTLTYVNGVVNTEAIKKPLHF